MGGRFDSPQDSCSSQYAKWHGQTILYIGYESGKDLLPTCRMESVCTQEEAETSDNDVKLEGWASYFCLYQLMRKLNQLNYWQLTWQ